jgi:hypothetical protein
MVHRLCFIELTGSSIYGVLCIFDGHNMQLAYGKATGSSRESLLSQFIAVSLVTFHVSSNNVTLLLFILCPIL